MNKNIMKYTDIICHVLTLASDKSIIEYLTNIKSDVIEQEKKDLIEATLLMLNNKILESIEIIEKYNTCDFKFLLSYIYLRKKEYKKGEEISINIYKMIDESTDAYILVCYNLATIYLHLKLFSLVEEYLKVGYQKDPNSFLINLGLGHLYRELKNYSQADIFVKNAIKINDKSPLSYYILGLIYYDLKQYPIAEINLITSLKIDSEWGLPHNCLGAINLSLNKINLAENYFKSAIIKQPDLLFAYYNIGYLLIEQKKYEEAEKFLLKSIELDPKPPAPYKLLVELYERDNKLDDAIKTIKKYLDIDKNDEHFKYLLDKYKIFNNPDIIDNINIKYKENIKIEQKTKSSLTNKVKGFVIFIDLCKSTEFKEKEDHKWYNRLIHFYEKTETCIRKIISQDIISNAKIYLLKYIGDELMFFIEVDDEKKLNNDYILLDNIFTFLENIRKEINKSYFLSFGASEDIIKYEISKDKIDIKVVITYADNLIRFILPGYENMDRNNQRFDILGIEVDFTARIKEV